MDSGGFEAVFIEGAAGRLFCVLHRPPAGSAVRGAAVYLGPLGEEMNKSRRMAALAARALAAAGWWVAQPDLHGCGDSEGDFAAAGWDVWQADALCVVRWLAARSGQVPMLWGLRAGCLLAAAVADHGETAPRMIFWQPAPSGRLHLQQWLRMKVAGAMIADGRKGGDGTRQLRDQLLAGTSVEVGGYSISPSLAAGLDGAVLAPPRAAGRLAWLEVSSSGGDLLPASQTAIEPWLSAGWAVDAAVVAGPPFWQTQEIEEVSGLIGATLEKCAGLCA